MWNPGVLSDGFIVETLLQPHESRPRNRLIATIFYLAGFIESWGRGYEKIQGQFELANLPMPTFEIARGGVITTIQRVSGDITPPPQSRLYWRY